MASRRGARPLLRSTRVRTAVSYAEPSSASDTDLDSSDSDAELAESSSFRIKSSRHSTRPRVQPTRSSRRFRAHQSDESDEEDGEDLMDTKPSQASTNRRSARNTVSTTGLRIQPSRRTLAPLPKRSRRGTRTNHSRSEDGRPQAKKRKLTKRFAPRSPRHGATSSTVNSFIYSGVIPAWQTLPYHILLQIFKYAAYPLYDVRYFQPAPSVTWLLKMARLCRQFTEPALTALYSSPPLVPMTQAHRLVDTLRADPSSMAFRYRQKIESLHIDVGQVVEYSLAGSGHLDLRDLIKDLPRLAYLELYHQKDMAPYRELDDTIKWTYPEAMFDALEYIDPSADPSHGDRISICKLRSWRWSSRLAGRQWAIENIHQVHLKPSFSALKKIAFVNYQMPSLGRDQEDPNYERILAESLKPLQHLEHLIFESSTLCNNRLLPMMPKSLRHLELINCWEVIADDFADFLLTHGSQLRILTLNHNQSLSLAFLPVLGTACPHLQVLKMNLTYYNLHATYRDSEPQYKQLLLPEQVPIWPSSLQMIELTQLRKWETAAAEMFFQSLLDSAASLPDLRKLTLQCILNIGWRDRASFREKWIGSLDRVFKRVSVPPRNNVSIRLGSESKLQTEPASRNIVTPARQKSLPGVETDSTSSPQSTTYSPARRSQRAVAQQAKAGLYAESTDGSEAEIGVDFPARTEAAPKPRTNGLAREINILRQTGGIDALAASRFSSSSDDDAPIATALRRKGKAREFVQGMCEVVEVRIDNLRPTEVQVTEADFLDSEVSGDEDWNGDDDQVNGSGYAW